jgi:hypothetical protein
MATEPEGGTESVELSKLYTKLRQEEDELLRIDDIVIRKIFAKRVRAALEKLLFDKASKTLAEELLNSDKSVEDILKNKQGKWVRIVKNHIIKYNELRDFTMLLIIAPSSPSPDHPLTLDQERKARELQGRRFYTVLTHNRRINTVDMVTSTTQTYDEIKTSVRDFLLEHGVKSKSVYIVFNGHGSESGELHTERDLRATSNSTFIADIYQIWDECKASQKDEDGMSCYLPKRIRLVLAQCYGYKHQIDDKARTVIDVICLTNEHHQKTKYCYGLNQRSRVVDSTHFELFDCGRTLRHQGDDVHDSFISNDTPDETPELYSPVMKILDFTSLGCLALCMNPSSSTATASMMPILDTKRHGPLALFSGISSVQFSLSSKDISDYYSSIHKAVIGAVVSPTMNLAMTPFGYPAVAVPETQHIKDKRASKPCTALSLKDGLKSVALMTNASLGFSETNLDSRTTRQRENGKT